MGQRKFDEAMQERFLELLGTGMGRYKAAANCGVHHSAVTRFRKATPGFEERMREAEIASTEIFEDKLREAALAGEPWALKFVLQKLGRESWKDQPQRVAVDVSGVVGHAVVGGGAGLEAGLAGLLGELAERQREVIEVTGGPVEAGPGGRAGGPPALGAGGPE